MLGNEWSAAVSAVVAQPEAAGTAALQPKGLNCTPQR